MNNNCHFCKLPVTKTPMHSKCSIAVAHFECWYEGGPFHPEKRDSITGKLAPLTKTRPSS